MVHNELHAIDLGIIAAYLIAMVAIGVVVVKKVQSTDDYYLGGRSFGPLVLMATVCATIIGGSGLMGRAGVAYSSGFKAIMTALPYLLGMFIFSGFAGRISAVGTTFNVTSIPDLFEQRFGKTAKVILGCLIAFTMMGTVASQVTATATIINMLGNEIGISYEVGALIACAVFIIYTATLQHLLHCMRQVRTCPLSVQATAIVSKSFLYELVAGGAIIQLVECIHLLPNIVRQPDRMPPFFLHGSHLLSMLLRVPKAL